MQGMSLLPFATPTQGARGKDLVFSEVDYRKNLYALRTKEWKIIHHPRFKDTLGQASKEYEVYHLASDPEERIERSDKTAPIDQLRRSMSQFRKHLEALSKSLGGNEALDFEIDPELVEELRAQGYLK